jgi:hypothetical protein
VDAANPAINDRLDYILGDAVELQCASVYRANDQLKVDLYWHVKTPLAQEVVTIVHGFDDAGNLVAQNDGPPLNGDYPVGYWLPGQNLIDPHSLPFDPKITNIVVGMYRANDGERLPITQAGQPVIDNLIRLPLAEAPCRP